jgi:hypothetical protein
MIQFWFRHAETCLDISEAFSIRKLGEGHAKELIQTGKRYHFVVAVVTIYALAKMERGNKIHDLSKNGSADVHDKPSPSAGMRNYGLSAEKISNRKVAFGKKCSCFSMR